MKDRAATSALVAVLSLTLSAAACTDKSATTRESVSFVPQVKPVQPRRVAFAPEDEQLLLVMEATGLVGVWDIRDLAQPVRVAWIPAGAVDAAFSADGKAVITAGWDGKLRWWSSVGGRLLRTSAGGHRGVARALAVAPDQVISGGEDGTLHRWNADGTALGEPIAAHDGIVVSVAIGPSGALASAGTDEAIRLWEKDASSPSGYRARVLHEVTGKKRGNFLANQVRYDANMGWDHALAFSPSGDALAGAAYDGGVRLWKASDWNTASTLNEPGVQHITSLAWTRGGETLAAGAFGGKVARWGADGSSRGETADHSALVLSVAFSPSGKRFATACSDDRVRLWSAAGLLVTELPMGAVLRATTVALTADGPLFASLDFSGKVRRLRIDGSPVEEIAPSAGGRVISIAFPPDGDPLVAGGDDGAVQLFGRMGKATWAPKIGGFLDAVAVSPNGELLAIGANGGHVEVPKINGWAARAPFRACQSTVKGFAFSGGDETLSVLCEDGSVKRWTYEGEARDALLEPGTGAASGLAISPAGDRLLSGGLDGTVGFWALPPRRLDESLFVGLQIQAIGLHGRGSWVSANGNTIFFFDGERRLVATAVAAPEGVVAFTPDGSFAGSDGVERLARVFRADGTPLDVVGTAARYAPRKVVEALGSY